MKINAIIGMFFKSVPRDNTICKVFSRCGRTETERVDGKVPLSSTVSVYRTQKTKASVNILRSFVNIRHRTMHTNQLQYTKNMAETRN